MAYRYVEFEEQAPGIGVVRLNDPPRRNAMSEQMGDEVAALTGELSARRDLRVVILTGSGEVFSAGGDFSLLERCRELPVHETHGIMRGYYEKFLRAPALEIPVVAAVNGAAIGAGLCLALACDFRVVARDARLVLNFVKLGLHPGMAATYFLPRLVGLGRAKELLLTGRSFDGEEAGRLGLAEFVCERERVMERSLELAREIAGNGALAVRLLKNSLNAALGTALAGCLEREAFSQGACYETAEYGAALARIRNRARDR